MPALQTYTSIVTICGISECSKALSGKLPIYPHLPPPPLLPPSSLINEQFRARELLELATSCPELERINVRYCPNLREDDIIKFQKLLPGCLVAYHIYSKRLLKAQHETERYRESHMNGHGG